jgi:hypothetical protein
MGKIWNSTLTRKTPLPRATKPLARSTKPIAKVTKKRAKKLREYEKNKAEVFKEIDCCQFPGCESEVKTLHHAGGRIGNNLIDKKLMRVLCPEHHLWAELNPLEAKKLNLSVSRLSKS